MSYRRGDRNQGSLFPPSVEDYVGDSDIVRAFDAMIDAMDIEQLGLCFDERQRGNPRYEPTTMLKLLVYGYSYGVRSSRKLERECHYNVSFMWLMGGLKPDHKTISEFRRNNSKALKSALKQSAQICLKLGLIEGNTLFVDGTKVRGDASIKNSWTKKKASKMLKSLDRRINEVIAESEKLDDSERHLGSMVELSEELHNAEQLKQEIEQIVQELEESDCSSLNTTDRDSARLNSVAGSFAGYNVQSVVDEKHGLIVSVDATSTNNDIEQLSPQLEQAQQTLSKKCSTACADSGYSSVDELEKVSEQDIKVVVPSQRQAAKKEPGEFDNTKFKYDSVKDHMTCPAGKTLRLVSVDKKKHRKQYQAKGAVCRACVHFGNCTKSKNGRSVWRLDKEDVRQRLEREFEQPESQAIYKLRQQKVELPFGHFKKNLKLDAFLLRGRDGANAEISIFATCFNVVRMIKCLGFDGFMEQMADATP